MLFERQPLFVEGADSEFFERLNRFQWTRNADQATNNRCGIRMSLPSEPSASEGKYHDTLYGPNQLNLLIIVYHSFHFSGFRILLPHTSLISFIDLLYRMERGTK